MENFISIGDKIDMELLVNGEPVSDAEKRRIFNCRVMDIPDPNILRITMPFFEGRIVPLSVGDQYKILIYASKGMFESRFVVVNRLKDGNLFLADMEIQEKLKKVQRREFYRHDCRLQAFYRIVELEERLELTKEELDEKEWKKAVILDISGGGLRMVSEFQEPSQVLIQLRFDLPIKDSSQTFMQYGNLLYSVQKKSNVILYEHHVEFKHISDKEREQIIGYIFEDERKKILKEKGLI